MIVARNSFHTCPNQISDDPNANQKMYFVISDYLSKFIQTPRCCIYVANKASGTC